MAVFAASTVDGAGLPVVPDRSTFNPHHAAALEFNQREVAGVDVAKLAIACVGYGPDPQIDHDTTCPAVPSRAASVCALSGQVNQS